MDRVSGGGCDCFFWHSTFYDTTPRYFEKVTFAFEQDLIEIDSKNRFICYDPTLCLSRVAKWYTEMICYT